MSASLDGQKAWVERVLGYRFANAGAEQPKGAAVRLAQGLLVWNNTRSYVSQQLKVLQQAILDQTQDEPDFEDIKAHLGSVEDILETLDDSLTDKLNELRGITDPAKKAEVSKQARDIVIRFQAYAAEDGLMNDIDHNGFVPLDIKPKVTAALAAVLQTI